MPRAIQTSQEAIAASGGRLVDADTQTVASHANKGADQQELPEVL
jgi:hypothetical protein